MFLFWGDWTILLVIPAFIFSIWAQIKVSSAFKKYSEVRTRSGMTGEQAARRILAENGITDVHIEHIHGELNDHFDPREKVIRLSDNVYSSTSAAAVGVAAHEAGHAAQYAAHYAPVKVRTTIVPATQFSSFLAPILFIIGLLFAGTEAGGALMLIGILLFALTAFFQLVTLPVEFNASRRAMQALKASGNLTEDELEGSKKVLDAAALTYVAALATSLLTLLRLILIARGGSRRR